MINLCFSQYQLYRKIINGNQATVIIEIPRSMVKHQRIIISFK
jgi:hypothetical protein